MATISLVGIIAATSSNSASLELALRSVGFYEQTANQITAFFQDIADTNSFVVRFDNDPRSTPTDDVWYRISVDFGNASQHELGSSSSFRVVGNLTVISSNIIGMGISTLAENADTIALAFRAINVGIITFGIPRITNVGRIGDNYQINITCPFMVDKAANFTSRALIG